MKKLLSIFVALALCYTSIAQTGQKFTIEVSSGADTTGSGDLYIRNQIAGTESKMTNYRSARLDSLFIKGVAQYLWNRAADYTARSFTDKGYVDSIMATLVRYTDTSGMLSAYLRIADLKFFDAVDVDSSGIGNDDLAFYDSVLGKIRFKAFPSIFDYVDSDSGLYVINTSGVTVHDGMLLWKGKADELYASLTGSYSNPSWISSLAWSKITGAPSFLTTETDPVYSGSSWFGTTNNSGNWNTAFGWGNHASAGYSTASNTQTFTNKTWNGVAIGDAYISSAATWNAKQAALVSGTNIKTINGNSLLGSGDLVISGSGGGSGLTSTATAAGTTTLTAASTPKQVFTGTSTQTIVLPDATTLTAGAEFEIINTSTVALPVEYDDATTLLDVLLQGSKTTFTLVDNSTSNGEWVVSEPELLASSARKMPVIVGPSGSTTAPTSLGMSVQTATTMSLVAAGNTNQWAAQVHKRFQTSTTAGNASGMRSGAVQHFASNVAGIGGFKAKFKAGLGSVNLNGGQLFIGMQGSVNALAGEPSALVNAIGIGFDAADASTGNFFLMHNSGTGTATKIDLGATDAARAVNTGFQFEIMVAPNSSEWWVKITNINTGALVYSGMVNTNVPNVNTALAYHVQCRNGAVAAAINVEFSEIVIQPF